MLRRVTIFLIPIFLLSHFLNALSDEKIEIVKDASLVYSSEHKSDFYPLLINFVTQKTQTYCGIASATIILNTIKKHILETSNFSPKDPVYFPYSYITQDNFFTQAVLNHISVQSVLSRGLTLDQLASTIQTFDVDVNVTHMDDSITYEDFMTTFIENMLNPHNYIIANYHRQAVGQMGGGHFSPVAAYNQEKDQFLILDVSRYKYAPLWVNSQTFFESMQGIDSDAKKVRGFLVISSVE